MIPTSSATRLVDDVAAWDRLRRPIWLFDPHTSRGLYANAAALVLWDAETLDELLARDFSKLSPAVKARTDRLAQETARGQTLSERWTFYPKGRPVTVQATISTFDLGNGSAALLFEAASIEVTEDERRAIEALRHTSSLITLFDSGGRALFTNPAAFACYGGGEHDFVARFHDPFEGQSVLDRAVGGESPSGLWRVHTHDGRRWHHLDARQVTDPVTGQVDVLLSERDVTAQVEAEQAARDADQRAEVAIAKQRFLANISHELRTPLTSVLGFAGLLQGSALEAQQKAHLDKISEAGTALLRTINDVIVLSELDCGELALDIDAFDPIALVTESLVAVQRAAEAKGLDLFFESVGDAPPAVSGDAGRLRAVLDHYLSNAIKFTHQGHVTVRLQTSVTQDGQAELELSVLDTGPGLTSRETSELFQRFVQTDIGTRKRFAGTGLGLAISKELISLMGGNVGVESAPGQGSRFWLRLALPISADAQPGDIETSLGGGGPMNVLYADDHENNRILIKAMLATQGHSCDLASDGAEAVRAVEAGNYDLILMDIQMPVMDGVDASRAIRALAGPEAATPILALTANTLSEQLVTYRQAGMNDCIAKPVNMAELLAKTSAWAATPWRAVPVTAQRRDAA